MNCHQSFDKLMRLHSSVVPLHVCWIFWQPRVEEHVQWALNSMLPWNPRPGNCVNPVPINVNDSLKTSQYAQTFWKMTPILCKVHGYSQSFTRRSQNNAPWPKNDGHLLLTQVTTLTDHCPTGADTGIHTLAKVNLFHGGANVVCLGQINVAMSTPL